MLRGGRSLVPAQGERVLLLAGDALRLGEELGGDAHVQRGLAGAREELGVEVQVGVHRDVVHVLQPADDLHVLKAGHDRVRRLVERLQARAAEAIDRRAAGFHRQAGHQRDRAGGVEALLALLLRVAQHDVFDFAGVDAGSLDQRADDVHGQIVGPHVAEHALLLVGPADRRAHAVDDHGVFHGLLLFQYRVSRRWAQIDANAPRRQLSLLYLRSSASIRG